MDFLITSAGSNFKLMPVNDKAIQWLNKNRIPYLEYIGRCFVIEHRRIHEVIGNIENDGLKIVQ